MKAVVPVLLALLVAAAALFLLGEREPADPGETARGPRDAEASSAPEPATLAGRGTPLPLERPEVDPDLGVEADDPETEVPGPTRRLEGLVTDERDLPVAGVRVMAAPSSESGATEDAVTGGDGRFVLEAFPATSVSLEVLPGPDWPPVPPILVLPTEASVHVRMRRGVERRVFVLDGTGIPVAGAQVQVHHTSANASGGTTSGATGKISTDESGLAVVRGLPARGWLILTVHVEGWPDVRYPQVPVGPEDLVLRLPDPVALGGVVVDEEGRALGGLSVSIDGCDPRIWSVRQSGETEVDSGRFRFEGLAPGRYRIDVNPPPGYSDQHARAFVEVPTPDLRIELSRFRQASGRVLGAAPGGVSLLWCLPGVRKSASSELDGAFRFGGLPDLTATLYAVDDASGDAFLREDVRPHDGPFVVELLPALTIAGRIPGLSDTNHAGMMIGARREHLLIEGTLLPEDRFEIRGVPAGTWEVQLWEDGGVSRVEGVEAGTLDVEVPPVALPRPELR